jgi:capsular polysaccharide transport system permease protein
MQTSRPIDYGAALGRWLVRILLLVGENFGDRQKRMRLSVIFAVLEPFGVIAVFALAHSLIFHRPQFGSSTILFLATGILPFYLFIHVSWRTRAWDTMRLLPHTNQFDMIVSYVLGELLTKLIIIFVASVGLWLWEIPDAIPVQPIVCLAALCVLGLLGAGIGLLNAVVIAFFPPWSYFYAIALRGLMVFSGVLYVADRMPPSMREFIAMNPLSHAIIYYRTGHYLNYPALTLDIPYLLVSTALVLAFGVLILDATRKWRPTR